MARRKLTEAGKFTIQRKTIGKSMAAKLKEIRAQLRKRMHARLPGTKKWMQQVARETISRHSGNSTRLGAFRRTSRLLKIDEFRRIP